MIPNLYIYMYVWFNLAICSNASKWYTPVIAWLILIMETLYMSFDSLAITIAQAMIPLPCLCIHTSIQVNVLTYHRHTAVIRDNKWSATTVGAVVVQSMVIRCFQHMTYLGSDSRRLHGYPPMLTSQRSDSGSPMFTSQRSPQGAAVGINQWWYQAGRSISQIANTLTQQVISLVAMVRVSSRSYQG